MFINLLTNISFSFILKKKLKINSSKKFVFAKISNITKLFSFFLKKNLHCIKIIVIFAT